MPNTKGHRRWLLGLAGLLWTASAARAGELVAVTIEGEEISGPLEALGPQDGLTIGGRKGVKLDTLAEIQVKNVPVSGAKDRARVYLRNGDVLCGFVVSGNENVLKIATEKLGEVELKLDAVLGLAFPIKEPPAAAVLADFLGPKDKDAVEDQILRAKGEIQAGTMEKFSDRELTFMVGGQKRTYLLQSPAEAQAGEALAALRFGVIKPYTPHTGLEAQLGLADGSRLSGQLSGFADGVLKLEHPDGMKFDVPLNFVRRIGFRGGRLVFLSALAPSAVEEKPLVGGAPVVLPWKKDLAVTGEKLKLARKEYARGLGVHSYCKLTYALGGQYSAFVADAGMDASAISGALCSWEVTGDGQVLKSGAAKAGGAAEKVKVDLKGVQKLELICDYGADNDDAGDHFDWADARLIK